MGKFEIESSCQTGCPLDYKFGQNTLEFLISDEPTEIRLFFVLLIGLSSELNCNTLKQNNCSNCILSFFMIDR